jgi:hypothetical protein
MQPGGVATEIEIAWTVSTAGLNTYSYEIPTEATVTGTVTPRICDGSANSCLIKLTTFAHADALSGTVGAFDNYYEVIFTVNGAETDPMGCSGWVSLADGANHLCTFNLDYYPTKFKIKSKVVADDAGISRRRLLLAPLFDSLKIDHFTISVDGAPDYEEEIAGADYIGNAGSAPILEDAENGVTPDTIAEAEWSVPNIMFMPNCFL